MTPYENHKKLNHKTSRYSPNGRQIIEECSICGMRFLHDPIIGYPVTLTSYIDVKSGKIIYDKLI